MTKNNRSEMLLSVQRALLGEVGPTLRGVGLRQVDDTWKVIFVYDGNISEADQDSATGAMAEVLADFDAERVEDEIIRIDSPESLPEVDAWAYVRRE